MAGMNLEGGKSLLLVALLLFCGAEAVFLGRDTPADVLTVEDLNSRTVGTEDAMLLFNLNTKARPMWRTDIVDAISVHAEFYITSLPAKGKLYQAYRQNGCTATYPQSCQLCCSVFAFDSDGFSNPTCCAKANSVGGRLYGVGDEISNLPAKVTILETSFIWYQPPKREFSTNNGTYDATFATFDFEVEYWKTDSPLTVPPTDQDSGCIVTRANCELAKQGDIWVLNNTLNPDILCEGNTVPCAEFCGKCSSRLGPLTAEIVIQGRRHYPVVGFGGYMIAFDGGDDFLLTELQKLPQYEFSVQFWFQQHKIRPDQSILTWWTDPSRREFEIADTSNIYFYHLNNRTARTGVSVDDGKWHHLAFSWRLVCREELRIPGATYCVEDLAAQTCLVDRDCIHVEIVTIVDGEERARSYLPPFLPSRSGQMIWGQRMVKPLKTDEVRLKEAFFNRVQSNRFNTTSNLLEPYTDNQLQLMFNRLRSGYFTDDDLLTGSTSRQAEKGTFTEDEPWRSPQIKYCELQGGGGFDPWNSLSGNIDEVRLYAYFRNTWDIKLDMDRMINADSLYTFSNPEVNQSLILYYTFDLYGDDFKTFSRDVVRDIPLRVRDESPYDGTLFRSEGSLGAQNFEWAPIQVPSTAPLYGSRTVQIIVPDSTQSIPIDLIDLAIDDDTPQSGMYSRIDVEPEFGELYGGADDCDTIKNVFPFLFEVEYQQPACKGSIIGIRVLGGLGTFTSNCAVGQQLTASDGFGSGALAEITAIGTGGVITEITMISFGSGYDWTLANPTSLVVDSATCLCGGNPGNVPGNMDACLQLLIHPGFADTSGAQFSGFSYPLVGDPFADRVTCSLGVCPATKPRPCLEACHRSLGWRSDLRVRTEPFNKDVVGPWVEYEESGFAFTYWSNSRHTVWYVPTNLRRANYYIQDDTGAFILQDTIKDQFLVRKFDHFPTNPFLIPAVPHPFVHLWVQIIYEKLAIALNSSVAWEESSEVLIHLQVLDFDRGFSSLNAPFSVYVDRPKRGQLYQAVRISRDDPNFERDCVCPSAPRFPVLLRSPETQYYPPGTRLPGHRPCRVQDLGQFCMKMGDPITADDELVTSYYDTRVLPGFQHARDGFFVIYEMGVGNSGITHFNWRLKHPQGQIQDAKVDIEIRAINNRPVALNTSATTFEDTHVEIRMMASDPDDPEKPMVYVTEFPKNGQLYQCNAASVNDACTLGEKLSDLNETIMQFGRLTVDYNGSLDDEVTPVFRTVQPKDGNEVHIIENSPNTSTVLQRGYGYSSYNFDPDEPNNFRKMCGERGTVAVDIWLERPIFYTHVEIFYPIRYDTPFRLLAERLKNYPIITYDYNVNPTNDVLEDILTSSTTVHQQGVRMTEDDYQRLYFDNDGEFKAERSFESERIFCQTGGVNRESLVRCSQRWDGTKYVKGEKRRVVEEARMRWFEMYRGMPHQAMAAEGRVSPILRESRILSDHFRLEACGQQGRVFGVESPNFMELLNGVRVTGTLTRRPQGFVIEANYRVVYVPVHNFVGKDDFWYVAVDSAGGAQRSPSEFSLQQHRSPRAHVAIEVSAKTDVPQGTNVVFSAVASGNETWGIDLPGYHPGKDGTTPVTSFQIELMAAPSRGELLLDSGSLLPQNALTPFSGTVRFGAAAGSCGMQYTSFRYRMKNVAEGDDIFSPTHSVTIQLRCRIGFWCNEADQVCEPCPVGTYGTESQWSPNSCVSCPAGKFQNALAATSCEDCPPGFHNPRPTSSRCYLCPEGTKNDRYGQAHCVSCPGGMYYPFKGSVACINCGPNQYTDSEGQYRCKECPINTRAISEVSTSIDFCRCSAGSYDVLGRPGRECVACPHGAYCHGRHLLPVPRTGYWTSQDLWLVEDTWDNETQAMESGRAFFIPCSFRYIRGACLGYPDVDVQEQEERCLYKDHDVLLGPKRLGTFSSKGKDISTVPCTLQPPDVDIPGLRSWISKQNYSANYYCAEGYTGIICSRCAKDFFRSLSGSCEHCAVFYPIPVVNLLWWGLIIFVNLLFWLFMFLAAAYRARSMYIFITHMQLIAILGRLSVPWPALAQGPFNRFALLNLDLDGMEWNCMGIGWEDYSARWLVELVIPVIIVAATYLYYAYEVWFAKAAVHATLTLQDKYAKGRRPRSTASSAVAAGAANRPGLDVTTLDDDKDSMTTKSTEDMSDGMNSDHDSEGSHHSGRPDSASTAASGNALLTQPEVPPSSSHRKRNQPEKPDRDVLVLLTPKEIRKKRDWGYWLTAMNINLLFVMAARIILIPWSCTTATPTLTYLDADPNMRCETDKHFNMKVLSILLGFFWFIVFPVSLVYLLRKAWYNELTMDRKFIRQFGWLFAHYNPKYVWWEVTVVLRKAVVVGIASLLSDNGYLQLMLLLVFLSLHLILTFYCMPHVQRRNNVVELFLQGSYLLLVCYALTNLVGMHGLEIVNTLHGAENTNERVGILQPQPGMEEIADVRLNNNFIVNVCFLVTIGLGMSVTICMLLYDIYEIKPHSPYWAPYLFNSIFGSPLYTWEEVTSHFMAMVDGFLTRARARMREQQQLKPPERPSSKWAHRVSLEQQPADTSDFQAEKTVEEMLHAVAASTQEQEWARDQVSVMNYIESINKRIFASEMYNSKAPNLPALERERNLAKKRLLVYMHDDVGKVFKSLYDQTGRNEQALWDIQEIERLTTHKRVMSVAQKEHGKQLEVQIKEQERRVGDVRKWKQDYENEKKRCEELEREVKQARDAVLLYHLESSASSEDEDDLDDMLEQRITEYIDNKTAQDLCNEGKMNPMQTF